MSLTEVMPTRAPAVVGPAVAAVVPVQGKLDVGTAPGLCRMLIETQATHAGQGAVVVDLSGVTLIDASGLGVLVAARKRARLKGGELVLRDPSPCVTDVLELTRLAMVFRVDSTTI